MDACSVWEETKGLNRTLGSARIICSGAGYHFVKYLHFPNGSKCYYKGINKEEMHGSAFFSVNTLALGFGCNSVV